MRQGSKVVVGECSQDRPNFSACCQEESSLRAIAQALERKLSRTFLPFLIGDSHASKAGFHIILLNHIARPFNPEPYYSSFHFLFHYPKKILNPKP